MQLRAPSASVSVQVFSSMTSSERRTVLQGAREGQLYVAGPRSGLYDQGSLPRTDDHFLPTRIAEELAPGVRWVGPLMWTGIHMRMWIVSAHENRPDDPRSG